MSADPLELLSNYWDNGGWSLITETQYAYVHLHYGILTKCLLAAIVGSCLGNTFVRTTWDLFNLCKVYPMAFFFLPGYRDSRVVTRRQEIALTLASFILAFGRVHTEPPYSDTYNSGVQLFPALGIYLVTTMRLNSYEKIYFNVAVWGTIIFSLYVGCPVFVNVFKCVTFRQYLENATYMAAWYAINVETVIFLFTVDCNHICWQIIVPMFFSTGGSNIVLRLAFGFAIWAAFYFLFIYAYSADEEAFLVLCVLIGIFALFPYFIALAGHGRPSEERRRPTIMNQSFFGQ